MDLKSIINIIKRCQYIRLKNICFDINAYLLSAMLCVGCKATWNNPVVERNENDSRISFVTIARPNKKEYSEGTARAIFLGKTAAYIEFLSEEEYEQFARIVSPYISKNKTICLDHTLQILSPGLTINSTKHLEKQLEIITKK